MEHRFQADLSGVRIHSDIEAARSALQLSARAYTIGDDIYFASGHFRPDTSKGRALLAHELTHVLQQRNGRVPPDHVSPGAADAHFALEREAEENELRAASATDGFAAIHRAGGMPQSSVSETLQAMKEALKNGVQAAGEWVIRNYSGEDGLLAKIDEVKRVVTAAQSVALSRETVAAMGRIYQTMRREAPSWLKLPAFQFRASPQGALIVAGVAVGALEIALFLLIVALMMWLLLRTNPEIRKAQDEAVRDLLDKIRRDASKTKPEPEPEPEPDPGEKPRPLGPDPIPSPKCSPTGLRPDDPIPMKWHKPVVNDWYPPVLTLDGHDYRRDEQAKLPHGEPIGVLVDFWPRVGKTIQLLPEPRGGKAADFQAVLKKYGFDWAGLQADHVQDLEWSGLDEFTNLWPMDQGANQSAGARHNNQSVSACVGPEGPYVSRTIQELKAGGFLGRWFVIHKVER